MASVAPQAVGDVDRPAILRPGFLDPIGRWPCRLTPYKRMQRCGAKIVAIGPDSDSCSAANGSLNNHPPQRVRAARDGDVERLSLMDQLALRLSSPSLKDSRPVRPTPSASRSAGHYNRAGVAARGYKAARPPTGAYGEGPLTTCAVTRRRFPVGANPTRRTLQPEATGVAMEVTK